ncbi:MAG: ExbD/TolR family protein [Phycisphaerales bacterium JB043]
MSTKRTERMRSARSRVGGALHMTPLIDVVFLLLMYFLLTARFFGPERSMEVLPPGEVTEVSSSDPYALPSRPITILIRSVGDGVDAMTIGSDSSLVPGVRSLGALTSVLRDARGRDMSDDQRFLVRCSPGSRWEHAMRALHAIRAAGFERVRLAEPAS